MIKWILDDTKRILKSHKTYLILLILFFTMFRYVLDFEKEVATFTVYNFSDEDFSFEETIYNADLEDLYDLRHEVEAVCFQNYPNYSEDMSVCSELNTFDELFARFNEDLSNEEYYEIKLYLLNIATDNFIQYYETTKEPVKSKLKSYSIDLDKIIKIKGEITETINPSFEPINLGYRTEDAKAYNIKAMNLYETFVSYQNNYPTDVKYHLTPSFFIANYLNDNFMLLIVGAILLIFDSFYRDYRLGVTKNILSAPMKRNRYLFVKTISSMLGLFVIIFIPLLIISIFLFVYYGRDTFNYPILVGRTTFSSFVPERKYLKLMLEMDPDYSTYRNICEIAPVSKFSIDVDPYITVNLDHHCRTLMPASTMAVMTLSRYITLTLLYFILIIIFISSLNTLMSLIFKNQIFNLIGLLALLGISLYLNNIWFGKDILKFLPFIFMSPTALMMQTIPYTFLNGVITLSLWSLALTLININLIKRKDFTY